MWVAFSSGRYSPLLVYYDCLVQEHADVALRWAGEGQVPQKKTVNPRLHSAHPHKKPWNDTRGHIPTSIPKVKVRKLINAANVKTQT